MRKRLFLLALLLNVLSANAAFKEPVFIEAAMKVYPNPASSYVIITYELKAPAPVVIEFTNMYGRVIKTFGQQSAPGQQRVNVALTNFPSGIYMVRIIANGAVESRKLVIY
jgi:hypothetical protein